MVGSDAFSDAFPTIYYLPGTTGWEATFADRVTARWFLPNPLILTSSPGPGVRNNEFGFTISWATNATIVVEASANLASAWVALQSVNLTNGSAYFKDPNWTNFGARHYRIRSP